MTIYSKFGTAPHVLIKANPCSGILPPGKKLREAGLAEYNGNQKLELTPDGRKALRQIKEEKP